MWIYLSLVTALCTTVNVLITKKLVSKYDPVAVGLISIACALPFMLFILLLTKGMPASISESFYFNVGISSIIDFVAFLAAVYAIRLSDVSLLGPLSSFIPLVTTVFAWIFLREQPEAIKFIGIVTIAAGAYSINIDSRKHGILAPFKALFTHRGVQLFLFSSVLWSITPLFQKTAIFETDPHSPLFASFFGYILLTFYYLFAAVYKKVNILQVFRKSFWMWILYGFCMGLSQWAAFTAFSLIHVGYASALFKLSSIFIVIAGAFIFKEQKFRERFVGSLIILFGTLLLIL